MTVVATVLETRRTCSSDRRFGRTHRTRHFPCRFRAELRLHSSCARRRPCRRHRARSAQGLPEVELRPARIARRGIGKEERAGKPRSRPVRWSAVLPLFPHRYLRLRDTDCRWSPRQPDCLDVSRVHDEGGVDVRSCHCEVKVNLFGSPAMLRGPALLEPCPD